ncbi:carboxyl transferase domain-containing protein [Bradyrhizobium sp. CB82]|uniref:acetyl-CoA carboxylase family protein n=1 Tax=Bradyrhizobium sp. CB82 TaxID=3039159 RepID=UPI0024B0829D|nr:carboxyl transferase domain-containing protein [Bradyrhizobium sp. CB82]WFU41532.1 carboxyl transferase domain-containing protein [Bradyrhizobium sp. CB82]
MKKPSVTRLLIANRGEIAIRIARAAAALDIHTTSVFSEDDRLSLHVCRTDGSFALRGRGTTAYLDIGQLIAAATEAGCDAIHPGYGFLSESEEFARRCDENGLTFVGPSPEHLAVFGNKMRARTLASKCRVPVPKGTTGALTLDDARAFYASLGPQGAMMIKAVAGGGGRGMRPVLTQDALADAFERCRSEAKATFGLGELYAEELVSRARHIEVQIVADRAGSVLEVGDRDCTLQRRRQKLIEIAPSPALDASVREKLGQAALSIARAVGYRNLGTFEFLVRHDAAQDPENGFVFLEVNPRIQVEHTVTEEAFGIDLVKTQLRIARGETLGEIGLNQRSIRPKGFAIQLRINMEAVDAAGNTIPSLGALQAFDVPSGPGVRVDTAGYSGFSPTSNFDSLLAKLIVHSQSERFSAAAALAERTLREFRVEGIDNNIGLLHALLTQPEVVAWQVDTGFVETFLKRNGPVATVERPLLFPANASEPANGAVRRDRSEITPDGFEPIRAATRGSIVSISIQEGDRVSPGQAVAVISAMKMEFVEAASVAGVVRRIAVSINDVVEAGDIIAMLEPAEIEHDAGGTERELNLELDRPELEALTARRALTFDAARQSAVDARHRSGHRTARENIADLCDNGSFVEYGGLTIAAQRARRPVEELIKSTPADGLISGIGSVNGALFSEDATQCGILAYDYTVLAGTQGHTGHLKTERIMKVAESGRLPVILFAEGGGGRPGDTDRAYAAGLDMETFSVFARSSAWIPRIGVVSGRCFAGNAAMLGCCDVIIATRDASIGMGGPAMIEGAGLGEVLPDDVGPVSVMAPNGVVDVVVEDDQAAVLVAKRYLSFFQGALREWSCNDQNALRNMIPQNRLRGYDMRAIVTCFADVDSVLELRQSFGQSVITAFARIEGRPIGIIASNPLREGGAIDSSAADKAARFMQLCDAFDLPIVALCDTPGFMVGPASERDGAVRHVSRLFVTASTLSVPYFCIVTRKCYGLGGMAIAAGSLHAPMVTVSWPTGEFGSMGIEGAVRLGFRRELERIADPEEREREYKARVARAYEDGSALNVASFFEVDDVIDPAQSRRWIVSGLRATAKRERRTAKRRQFVDTW